MTTDDREQLRMQATHDVLSIITDQRADEPDSDDALIAGAVAEHLVAALVEQRDQARAHGRIAQEEADRLSEEYARALDGEARARQECNECHEEIVRVRRLLRGMARRVGQYRRAKSEETRALWAMEGERDQARADLVLAAAEADDARDGGMGLALELGEAQRAFAQEREEHNATSRRAEQLETERDRWVVALLSDASRIAQDCADLRARLAAAVVLPEDWGFQIGAVISRNGLGGRLVGGEIAELIESWRGVATQPAEPTREATPSELQVAPDVGVGALADLPYEEWRAFHTAATGRDPGPAPAAQPEPPGEPRREVG